MGNVIIFLILFPLNKKTKKILFKDEDKDNLLKLNYWRKWLKKFRNIIDLDHSLLEHEATFYSATAGGNPEEQ